jgi:hypothetical protein
MSENKGGLLERSPPLFASLRWFESGLLPEIQTPQFFN